ncbi:cadherin-related family member 2 [Xyrichtys novacula]|uniref:Cadherin-related family member 2 n=1 Tax=Xyrichtys novacula TaxID=13765 RepID=A0AAV1FBP6_XYRNO|nr:cadherin-related family member 2 [Xyrichtys novacula]
MEGFSRGVLLCLLCAICQINANEGPDINNLVYNVCEDVPVGEEAFTIDATDPDNDPLTFSISGVDAGFFVVEENTGRVTVQRPLERDKPGGDTMPLDVTVSDGRNPPVIRSIIIVLLDANDNRPIFETASNDFTLPENMAVGSSLFRMMATDADSSSAAVIHYSIDDVTPSSGLGLFTIVRNTGEVKLLGNLNYTALSTFYRLQINATDGGGKCHFSETVYHSSIAYALITVEDVPDLDPQFLNVPYMARVEENSPLAQSVFKVTAIDQDTGVNDEITFTIEDSTVDGLFQISNDGTISVSSNIDREELGDTDTVILTVKATEANLNIHGVYANTTANVQITIIDTNDNKPEFAEASYEFFVKEGEKGAFVGSVTAEDPDQIEDFNRISFGIVDGSFGSFIIRTHAMERGYRGNLAVDPDIELDYESDRKQFRLLVEAVDPGQLSAEVMVVVNVEDVNDERPEFRPTAPVTVKENTTISEAVGRFTAQDRDGNHSLVYELESIKCRCNGSLTPCSYFLLDPTGEVRLNPEIVVDYEQCDQVLMEAQVVDEFTEKGENNSVTTEQMVINIEDINDNIPEFILSDSVFVVVSESASKGTSVARVTASDQDSGINRRIEFEVTAVRFKDSSNQTNNMGMLFEAVTTQQKDIYVGVIQTMGRLDVTLTGKYLVTVRATDTGGLYASTELEIFTGKQSNIVVLEFSSSEEEVRRKLNDIIRALTAATAASIEIVKITDEIST